MTALEKKFKRCELCKRDLVRHKLVLGMQVKTESKWPVCLPCAGAHWKEEKFQKWLQKKIHAST